MNALLLTTWPMLAQTASNPPSQDNSSLLVWAVLLLGMAFALFCIEIFVPSGGLIGSLSAACLIGGVVLLFRVDTTWGLIGATLALVALPFAIAFSIKIWPNTPLGRALTLKTPGRSIDEPDDESDEEQPAVSASPATPLQPAAGATGESLTELRPVGICLINGKREECLAVGGVIEPGTQVRVVAVDGMHIRVRSAE